MSRKKRNFLIGLNALAFVAGLFWHFCTVTLLPAGGPAKVSELDRHQVINEAELRAFDPKLADNTRHNVGTWMTRDEVGAAQWTSAALVFIALVNCVVLLRTKSIVSPTA